MKYCPNCGNEAQDAAIICVKCGMQFNASPKASGVSAASKPATLNDAFRTATLGSAIILLGTFLTNLNDYVIQFFHFYGLNIYRLLELIFILLILLFGVTTLAGVVLCIIACTKVQKSEALNPFDNTESLNECFNFLKLGIIIVIATTVMSYIGSFLGTNTSLIYILRNSDVRSMSNIIKALIGLIFKIANYAGMALCVFGCFNGIKATEGK